MIPLAKPASPSTSKASKDECAAKEASFGDWVDRLFFPTPKPSDAPPPETQDSPFLIWVDSVLLPPGCYKALHGDKSKIAANKDQKPTPPTSDPFCSIPALMKLNICCAETVDTTKGADEQSHSTISEEIVQEEREQIEALPTPPMVESKPTTSSPFEAWKKFFTDFNSSICGSPPAVDGLPPTIDIATPINIESSLATLTAEDKPRQAEDGSNKATETILNSSADPESHPEENEAVVNETIVIYYTDSGSTDGNNKAETDTAQALAGTATSDTVIRVHLDPWKQDDAILQERESFDGYETPDASVTNLEAESTGAIVSSPIRFQNLATGSFCEIASDGADADQADAVAATNEEEEEILGNAVSVEELKPLVEEEEDDDDDDETKEEALAAEDETAEEPVAAQSEEADDEEDEGDDDMENDHAEEETDLKVLEVMNVEQEEQEQEASEELENQDEVLEDDREAEEVEEEKADNDKNEMVKDNTIKDDTPESAEVDSLADDKKEANSDNTETVGEDIFKDDVVEVAEGDDTLKGDQIEAAAAEEEDVGNRDIVEKVVEEDVVNVAEVPKSNDPLDEFTPKEEPAIDESSNENSSECNTGANEKPELTMDVESSGTSVRMVSLFVGNFNSPDATELH